MFLFFINSDFLHLSIFLYLYFCCYLRNQPHFSTRLGQAAWYGKTKKIVSCRKQRNNFLAWGTCYNICPISPCVSPCTFQHAVNPWLPDELRYDASSPWGQPLQWYIKSPEAAYQSRVPGDPYIGDGGLCQHNRCMTESQPSPMFIAVIWIGGKKKNPIEGHIWGWGFGDLGY